MAEALDNSVERKRRGVELGILEKRETGFCRTDLGDSGGKSTCYETPAGNGNLYSGFARRDHSTRSSSTSSGECASIGRATSG